MELSSGNIVKWRRYKEQNSVYSMVSSAGWQGRGKQFRIYLNLLKSWEEINVKRTYIKQLQWLFETRDSKVRSSRILNRSEKMIVCKSCKSSNYSKKLKETKCSNIPVINVRSAREMMMRGYSLMSSW